MARVSIFMSGPMLLNTNDKPFQKGCINILNFTE